MDSATLERFATQATRLSSKGRVEHDDDRFNKPGVLWAGSGLDVAAARGEVPELDPSLLPDHIRRNLERAGELAGSGEPRGSMQTWEETLYNVLADGTAVTASGTETIMLPIFTLPAGYFYPGRLVKWTVLGRQSTAITTPGTITLKLSYSATGVGAVTVASSGAFAPDPTAAATNLTFMVEFWMLCRSSGTAGTALGWGRVEWSDYDDASAATVVGNLNMRMIPTSAPATVAIDTTVARAVSPTYTSSVGTASMTAHAGFLEAVT
jgi:hypothetical protein